MKELFLNKIIWISIISNLTAQILKVVLVLITQKKLNFRRLIETGGMPSSHASTVAALATSVGFQKGWGSPEFGISAILAAIVIFDATGIRRAAGEHAEILNSMMDGLQHVLTDDFQQKELKTLLGHSRKQVFVGTLLGIAIGIALSLLWK